jgi:hypothetical protein
MVFNPKLKQTLILNQFGQLQVYPQRRTTTCEEVHRCTTNINDQDFLLIHSRHCVIYNYPFC